MVPSILRFLPMLLLWLLSACHPGRKALNHSGCCPASSGGITSITLVKEGCGYECAEYTISIRYPNVAELTGKKGLPYIGRFTRILEDEEADSLWSKVDRADLWSMQDSYHFDAEDTQARILTAEGTKGTKKIRFKMMMPHTLTDIEKYLDVLSQSGDWKPLQE
ncbi:MAG: hypothetical protein KDD36_07750 [Flavobacteriales bacterium]|nr:hypothetical protein [Flavobacteriales bacterium]